MAMRKGGPRRHSGPSLSRWNVDGNHYTFNTGPISKGGREYLILQFTAESGHTGYFLTVFPGESGGGSVKGLDARGNEVAMVNTERNIFRSPQAAARAAGLHMARH